MQNQVYIQRTREVHPILDSLSNMVKNKQFVIQLITGEAGTGKSVICQQFMEQAKIRFPEIYITTGFCSINSDFSLPYTPFKDVLRNLVLTKEAEDLEPSKIGKKLLGFGLRKMVEYAPDLIGSFIPGGTVVAKYGEEFLDEMGVLEKFKRRPGLTEQLESIDEKRILSQYTELLQILSQEKPICIVLDDFQWADKASINMLYFLSRSLEGFPIFFLIAYRSTEILEIKNGERHPFVQVLNEFKRRYGRVISDLDALEEETSRELMNQLVNIEPNTFDKNFRNDLYRITGGNPLFVDEMLNSLKDNFEIKKIEGIWTVVNKINWHQKPARIEGIIEERIGKLEDTILDLLTHASVQGNLFIAQVLSHTIRESDREVLMSLSRKLQKENNLVREINCIRTGKNMVSMFQFSNSIFQHYLYEELSLSQKMMLHGDIADCLVEMFSDNLEDVAFDIARHYELSGEQEKAIAYLEITATSAIKVSQFEIAVDILNKALQIIEETPPADHQIIISILGKLSICKRALLGWDHAEVINLCNKTIQLGREFGEIKAIAPVQFGMWAVLMTKMKLSEALDYALDYCKSGKEINDDTIYIQANVALMNTYFWMNRQQDALDCIEETTRIGLDLTNETFAQKFGQTPASLVLMFRLVCNYFKGNRQEAEAALQENLTYLKTVKHLYTKAIVLTTISWYYYLNEENENGRMYIMELIEMSKKNNFQFYRGLGLLFNCASTLIEYTEKEWMTEFENAKKLVYEQEDNKLFKVEFDITYARFLIEKNRLEEAENVLRTSADRIINSEEQLSKPRIYYYFAKVFLLQGKMDMAAETISQGLKFLNPENTNSPTKRRLEALQLHITGY